MDESNEPVAHLGLPIAIAAAGGAAVVGSMTRFFLLGPWHLVFTVVIAALVGGAIGTILTHSLRCDPLAVTMRKATAFVAIAAPLTTLVVTLIGGGDEGGNGAIFLGVLIGAAMLPATFLAVHLARAAQRSRVRSLLGRSDRRAAWRATAAWLALVAAIGCAPAVSHAELFWWNAADKTQLMAAPLLVAVVACAIAFVVAALDWRAESLVIRAYGSSAEWRIDTKGEPRAPARGEFDVGVGHDTWMQHVSGRATYRENALERVAAFGDLSAGAELLTKATRRSAIALAIVAAAQLATLYVYSTLTLKL